MKKLITPIIILGIFLINFVSAECTYMGEVIPCDEMPSWPFFLALGFSALMFLLMALTFSFWIWMLIDAVKREYPEKDGKLLWVLVIIFTGFIGAVIYYFVIKRKNSSSEITQIKKRQPKKL